MELKGMSLLQEVENYQAISAAGITLNANGYNYPMSVYVDYAAFSISGARQLVCDLLDAGGNLLDRIFAGATVSALGHRYFSFGFDHQNMTAFVALASSGASAGYLSTALPRVKLPPSGQIKVYDLASITNSDTVQVTVSFYLDQTLRYAQGG